MLVRRRPRLCQVASTLLVLLCGLVSTQLTGATSMAGNAFDASDVPAAVDATFIVNSAADPGEGMCNSTNCTLRKAITAANSNVGLDSITFNIPGPGPHTISPTEALPTITSPIIIDGYTQPGSSANTLAQGNNAVLQIELGVGKALDCLRISAGGSTVRGLVINRCGGAGIYLEGSGNNVIVGNFIGTDVTGTKGLGALVRGLIYIDNVPNNRIGGTSPGARNVLSGSEYWGISILGSNASGNLVQGNYIGTDKTGSQDPDTHNVYGIYIANAPNNTIGGTASGAGNLISANSSPNVSPAQPGTVIVGAQAIGNVVQGNYIGTDATGSVALGNAGGGVLIASASNNTVGGTAAGAGNVISGNGFFGVSIHEELYGEIHASNNRVQGNLIGTDKTGMVALPNGGGVSVTAANNIVGGAENGAGNVISGNSTFGVHAGGSYTVIQGNLIGTNKTGDAALPNAHYGIFIRAWNITVGGTAPGAGNLISGNGQQGILIWQESQATVAESIVQGNYIGTNKAGTAPLGNGDAGIRIEPAYHTVSPTHWIGGIEPGAANVIAGNGGDGVLLRSRSTIVEGNYIGTNAAGAANIGNGGHGVVFTEGTDNRIGGMGAGAGNIIAYNAKAGIASGWYPQGTRNVILRNLVFSNGGLGVDLYEDGVTPNDPGDTDTGSNKRQNFPVLSSISSAGGSTTITGTLNSISNTTYTLHFFINVTCDPSGYGEGQWFLGSGSVTTDSSSNAPFAITLHGTVSGGQGVTSLAIDPEGNTSEFSNCIIASGPTATSTATRNATQTTTPTSTVPVAATPTGTSPPGATPTPTDTACTISFADVPPGSTFYVYVRCLACRNILSGYEDGTFRPGNQVTRGQLAKIVANAAGFNEEISGQTFSDVLPGSTFYPFVERMVRRGVISGYEDGTFRPGNAATRGQISKIVANAAEFREPVAGQTFNDVPPDHTFHEFIERLSRRGVISGYEDGTFRPGNNASRGQVAKIVSNTFLPGCKP